MKHSATRALRAAAALAALAVSFSAFADSPKLVNKIVPEFPREARAAGVEKGLVKARVTLDSSGEVTKVDIVESAPRRVFDRAVIRSLSQWKYETGGGARTVDVDVEFKL